MPIPQDGCLQSSWYWPPELITYRNISSSQYVPQPCLQSVSSPRQPYPYQGVRVGPNGCEFTNYWRAESVSFPEEDASPGFFTEIQHLLGFVFLVGTVASVVNRPEAFLFGNPYLLRAFRKWRTSGFGRSSIFFSTHVTTPPAIFRSS